jgi:hypothetical protein
MSDKIKHEIMLEYLNQALSVMEKYGYAITLEGKNNSVVIEISDIFIMQREPFFNMTDAIFDHVHLKTRKVN